MVIKLIEILLLEHERRMIGIRKNTYLNPLKMARKLADPKGHVHLLYSIGKIDIISLTLEGFQSQQSQTADNIRNRH